MIDLEEDTNSSSTSKRSLVYQYFTFKTSRYYCNNSKFLRSGGPRIKSIM